MDVYGFGLVVGAGGLAAMALSGLTHRGHAGHENDASHVALPGHGGARATASTASGTQSPLAVASRGATTVTSRGGSGLGAGVLRFVWQWLSPRVLFSTLAGFGAAGLVLRAWLHGRFVLLPVAIALGIAFEKLLAAPLWNATLRFGSAPAHTLEACVAEQARAVTSFDANGDGLVALELDGHVVQLLATLRRDERASGIRVRSGEMVLIEDVDIARHRCTVSRMRH